MASNSYGAGGWGSDDDIEMIAPPVVVQRPRGRADEGRGGGGQSSRGGGGQPSSRSYPSSRGDSSSSSSRQRDIQQDGPSRDRGFDGSRIGMEQHRQQHQNRPFQRRPSPPPLLPSSSSSHLPSSSSQRRRSRSPPRATSIPSSELPHGNHHQSHRHKPSARRRRERSSSPLDDGSPPLPSNPPSKPSSNAIASSSTYHPKDTSPPPRTLSRTTSSSSNPNHSHAQRVTASPFSISSQTVSPPSVTRYSPTFHCEVDYTPVPQPHRSAASSARPLPPSNNVASSSRLRAPPSSKPATWPSAADPTQKKKLVRDFSDDEEEDEAPPRKTYDGFSDEVDEIDETESEGEVVDLRGKQGRMDVEEEMEDSGPDVDSDDDEVQEIKPTPRPAPAPSKPAPPPPHTRRSPPPPPPQQGARVSSSSSSRNSIPPTLHSTSPDAHDIKAASAPTSFDLSNNFQPHRPEFAPPPVSQTHKQNPFSRHQNHPQHHDPQNGPVLPKHWIAQPRPPRESFGGPRSASQLAAILPGGRGGGGQQQFPQPMGMQQWGGGMMPPGAIVPLQHHQPFFPQQQPFFPPPTLGNRTPSYGSQGNRTPRAAVFGAHQLQWFEEDANGNVVSLGGGGGPMSPDQGSGGGSVRSVNGGGGGSMSPPQGGGSGATAYVNPPQVQHRRSSEVKLQYRSLDSYPRLTPAKESEYKERKERCVELLKKVPGPDGRRALKVEEVETVTWYLSKVNLGLLNKVDLDEDPYFTCENSATFFKGLMSRSEYDGFKAARKELAFLISLQTDRSKVPVGMRPSQIAQVKSLLEEIKPRLDLLEDLISLRHPIFHTPPPITKGTLLSDEWEKALVKAKKKDAEARATHKLGRDKENRALMEQFETEVTAIVKRYIDAYLGQYTSNPLQNWKSKDTAIYLLTSIASRGATLQHGVTSTNVLVDVVEFFSQNVFQDLQGAEGSVNLFLLVDAIKFLHTFRNQLTKDQLLSVLPLLIQHLSSSNYVVYSYAATTIERILFIKVNGQALFSQADVRPFAQDILMALFTNIERGQTPEKMAENDYLMRCVMRVILTARQSLTPVFLVVLQHLVGIIGQISKNPSNPKFNQYTFESVSALIRFVAEGTPATLGQFEGELFGPIMTILQQDVLEFVPYVFQILSQLLELHPTTTLPEAYQNLLGPLLTASLWEQRGNVPALVRLWKALLKRGAPTIVANNQVQSLLGVFQKLIGSNINDVHGFSLLQALFESVPIPALQQYIRTILVLLSTRLQSSKTPTFVYSFVYFFCYILAVEKEGLTPDFVIAQYEGVQPGIFGGILQGIVLPQVQKIPVKDRKVVAVGITRLLTQSQTMLTEPLVKSWPATLNAVLALILLPVDLTATTAIAEDDISGLDFDDGVAGFQASFARLGASEAKKEDPVAWLVEDEKTFLKTQLEGVAGSVGPLLQQVDPAALARLQS